MMNNMFALGVDGVITNNPRFAFSVPKDTNPSSEGYPAWQLAVIVVGASLGSFVLGLTVLGLIVKCKSTQQRRSAGFQQV